MVHLKHLRKGRKMTSNLDLVGHSPDYLERKHAARERALPKSRSAIRSCANSIRATIARVRGGQPVAL